jgi:tRNA threonylcarbamoyladenosine dehydratase
LINPGCHLEPVAEFLTAATADRLLSPDFNYVVDAVDRMSIKALIIAGCRAQGRPVISVGGAGGRRDPTRIRTGDIGESGDPLLRLVRKRLRREHGFASGAHRGISRVGVKGVWSEEKPVFPWSDGTCATQPEPESNLKLDCESGLGTAMFVTAAFGLAAAGVVVRTLAAGE